METTIKKAIQNLSFFSLLILFTFSLLSFSTKSEMSITLDNNSVTRKEITLRITKKTTLQELQNIKKQMMDEGLGFDFSDVVYNEKNEIIAISIRYKDASNNSGNYSVSSKNPINDIVIVSEESRISVTSAGSSNQSFISQGNGAQVSNNMEKSHTDQSEAMKQRSEQMEKEMESQMNEMYQRQAEMMNLIQQRRDSINTLNQPQVTSATNFNGRSRLITKNTTNSELLGLENSYDSENISFYYKNLERNENNEITHISITIDNRNGSVSTSGFGNGKEAIKNITVAVDKQNTIIKSAE